MKLFDARNYSSTVMTSAMCIGLVSAMVALSGCQSSQQSGAHTAPRSEKDTVMESGKPVHPMNEGRETHAHASTPTYPFRY